MNAESARSPGVQAGTDSHHQGTETPETFDISDKVQMAAYLRDMTCELAKLARGSELKVLSYLLDVCSEEAAALCAEQSPRLPRSSHRKPRTGTVQET